MPVRENISYGDRNVTIWFEHKESERRFEGSPRYKETTIRLRFPDAGVTIELNPEILDSLQKASTAFLEDWRKTERLGGV